MDLPFVTRRATHADVKSLIKLLPPPRKPNKDGFMYLPGDEFAKSIADLLGSDYVNNKAPFDVVCGVGDIEIGVEVKKQHYQPTDYIYAEFFNGTATVWKFIEACSGLTPEYVTTQLKKGCASRVLAQQVGDALCDFCWHRWTSYAKKRKKLCVERSVFVIGQLFENTNRQQVCKIFTFPLANFPKRGELSWHFNESGMALHGMVEDHVMLDWYWKNNGQCKIHPAIAQCNFESPTFRTHTDDYEKVTRLIDSDRTFQKIDQAILKSDPKTGHQLLKLAIESSGCDFASHYGEVLKELNQLRRAAQCHS